jgi:hypothetical protein
MEREQPALEAAAKPKKPYQIPSFRVETVFETTALACTK